MQQAFIGIDVGTSSARAGVFDENGTSAGDRPASDHGVARGGQRRRTVVVRDLGSLRRLGPRRDGGSCHPASAVKGMGFDATCSLVVLDAGGHPLTVSSSGDDRRNVIVWMDHRAMAEARRGQRDAGRGAALCRRFDLAGNGNSKAALAEAAPAVDLSVGRSFLRPCRLSFVSRHRIDGAIDVHGGLQMELSRPRSALERAAISSASVLAILPRTNMRKIGNGDRRARHAAGRRPDEVRGSMISACSRVRRSARR